MMKKNKCPKCKGTGNIKKKHFTVLNWPIAVMGFIFGRHKYQEIITEKRPGYVEEVKACPICKGTGRT